MYANYWGLTATPFHNTADVRWYQDCQVHEEALARLFYLVEQRRRCGVLIGAPGTGKSYLLKLLARQVTRTQRQVATVDLLGLDGDDLLLELAAALRLAASSTKRTVLWRDLEDHLKGSQSCRMQIVLMFDHLDRATGDCVQMFDRLLRLASSAGEYITVVVGTRTVVGSTLLEEMTDLRIDLGPLDRRETGNYVQGLMQRAGRPEAIFDEFALDLLYEQSGGIPRAINRLCDLSLLAAMAAEQTCVDARIVMSVSLELQHPGELRTVTANAVSRF